MLRGDVSADLKSFVASAFVSLEIRAMKQLLDRVINAAADWRFPVASQVRIVGKYQGLKRARKD